jgi:hypothetical protein
MTEKYGCWVTGGKKFLRKFDALVHATKHNKDVKLYYHNDVWQNFDRSKLGKQSLDTLYRERAQQLRDKYDYLILYYSGGSDSHNVLRTFIDNNIKLDEVCVKWPKTLQDGNLYIANTVDKSARNFWSEWDYAIVPSLKVLAQKNPEIKITIKDYIADVDRLNIESMFENLDFVRGGAILMNSVVSDSERTLLSQGRTVGHIYGVDKPLIYTHQKKLYMFFSDIALDAIGGGRVAENPLGAEAFYWTPDMPELAFEQAYQMCLYYRMNPDKHKYLWTIKIPTSEERAMINQFQTDLARSMLYSNWNHRFQADKPHSASRSDKFFWFYEHGELIKPREQYYGNLLDRVKQINTKFLNGTDTPIYNVMITNYFYVTSL